MIKKSFIVNIFYQGHKVKYQVLMPIVNLQTGSKIIIFICHKLL